MRLLSSQAHSAVRAILSASWRRTDDYVKWTSYLWVAAIVALIDAAPLELISDPQDLAVFMASRAELQAFAAAAPHLTSSTLLKTSHFQVISDILGRALDRIVPAG
jgi:hypothetical protein